MFVGIFTAIKVFNWVATMYRGSIDFKTPFIYFVGFLFFLFFGGMTGVALGTVSLDIHWQDTYFVVAHFHFLMVGSTMMAFLAALHYWFPKITGRTYPEGWGLVGAVLVILGFNFTFIPQFLLGNEGMPRRYFAYPERFWALNVASTAGASVLGRSRPARRSSTSAWNSAPAATSSASSPVRSTSQKVRAAPRSGTPRRRSSPTRRPHRSGCRGCAPGRRR